MDIDFYGYKKEKVGKQILSSDFAALYFASTPGGAASPANKLGLVQGAAVAYQQQVQPRFEAGSHELYWLSGQSMGSVTAGRLIGENGILDGIQHVDNPNRLDHGALGSIEFKLGRLSLERVAVRQDVLVMRGCVLQGFSLQFNAGGLDVSEQLTIQTALMKRSSRN